MVKTEDGNFAIWVSGSVNKMNRVIVDHIGLSSLLLIHVLAYSDCLCKFIIILFYAPWCPGLNILYIFGNLHNIMCIVCNIVYMIAITLKYGRLIN